MASPGCTQARGGREHSVLMLALLALVLACGQESPGTSDTASEGTGAAHCEPPAGECFLVTECYSSPCELPCDSPLGACSGATLCSLAIHYGVDGTPSFAINSAVCALEALRDRTPGVLSLSSESGGSADGSWHGTSTIYSPGDGTAIVESERVKIYALDVLTERSVSGALNLHPPSYYDACLAESTIEGLLPCLQKWHTGTCVDFPGCG